MFEPKSWNNCRTVRKLLHAPMNLKKKPFRSTISDWTVVQKKEPDNLLPLPGRWRDLITFWCDRFYWGFVHFESSQPSRANCFLQKCFGLLVGHHCIEGHFNHHRKRPFPVVHRKKVTGVHFEDWNCTTTKGLRVALLTPIPTAVFPLITWDLKYPSQSLMRQIARAFCGVQSTAARNIRTRYGSRLKNVPTSHWQIRSEPELVMITTRCTNLL